MDSLLCYSPARVKDLKTCAKLYKELRDYGEIYTINYEELAAKALKNPSTRLSDLPKTLEADRKSMADKALPYAAPYTLHFCCIFLLLVLICWLFLSYLDEKGRGSLVVVTLITGVIAYVSFEIRFGIGC